MGPAVVPGDLIHRPGPERPTSGWAVVQMAAALERTGTAGRYSGPAAGVEGMDDNVQVEGDNSLLPAAVADALFAPDLFPWLIGLALVPVALVLAAEGPIWIAHLRRGGVGLLLRVTLPPILLVGLSYAGCNALPLLGRWNDARLLLSRLAELRGLTGLDPLDPVQPLERVDALVLGAPEARTNGALVRFTYAGGGSRDYAVLLSYREGPGGWLRTDFDRSFAPHLELTDLPFADETAPLRIGEPTRLAAADRLADLDDVPKEDVRFSISGASWAPRGNVALLHRAWGRSWEARGDFWLVSTDGLDTSPLPFHGRLDPYGLRAISLRWLPDGSGLAYHASPEDDLFVTDLRGQVLQRIAARRPLPFALDASGILYALGGLYRVPYATSAPAMHERLRDLPDVGEVRGRQLWRTGPPLAPSPGGERIAYACGLDVCLADFRGDAVRRVPFGQVRPAAPVLPATTLAAPGSSVPTPTPAPPRQTGTPIALRLAWSPDGRYLAAVRSSDVHQPWLGLLAPDGTVLQERPVGPNGFVDVPQWAPDGAFVFLPAYPAGGRRIVALETATGRLFDLSRPRWDAEFALSPDGRRLLLANGRGGVWLAPVLRRDELGQPG